MNREMRLRYMIQLSSNLGPQARQDAQAVEAANRNMARAYDTTERSAGRLDRTMRALGNNSSLERQAGFANALARGLERARAGAEATFGFLQRSARLGAQGFAGGAAALYAADRVTRAPIDFDLQLRYAALTAYGEQGKAGVRSGMDTLRGIVNKSVRAYGGSREQALRGYSFMVGTGEFSASEAEALLPDVQEAAVGTATDVEKLANLSMRVKSVMGVQVKRMRVTLSRLARVGQLGGVELDQQAGFLADLAGNYGGIGYTGERGAVAAAVDLQLAFKGAGSADSARTILDNFYGKILSNDTARDFSKLKGGDGRAINLHDEIAKRVARGMDGVESFLDLTDEILAASGGEKRVKAAMAGVNLQDPKQYEAVSKAVRDVYDKAGIGAFLQDKEAMRGYLSLRSQRDLRQSMIAEAMGDNGETLNTISGIVQDSTAVRQQKAMAEAAIATEQAFRSVVTPINGVLDGATALAKEFPDMATALAALTGAATVAAAGLSAVGIAGLLAGGKGALAGARGAVSGAAAAGAGAAGAAGAAAGGAMRRVSSATERARSGMTGPLAGDVAKAKAAARMSLYERSLGKVLPVLTWGSESWDALTNDDLTNMGKAREVASVTAGAGAGWYGAGLGAGWGTAVAPGIGTVLGGVVGGALGYWGGRTALDWMIPQKASRDLVTVTDPQGIMLARPGAVQGAGKAQEVQIGQGVLRVDLTVSDERVSFSSTVNQQMDLLRIDSGNTNPGSFASISQGGF